MPAPAWDLERAAAGSDEASEAGQKADLLVPLRVRQKATHPLYPGVSGPETAAGQGTRDVLPTSEVYPLGATAVVVLKLEGA